MTGCPRRARPTVRSLGRGAERSVPLFTWNVERQLANAACFKILILARLRESERDAARSGDQ